MLPASVTGYLDDHRREHIERLLELLRIPGIANVDDDACPRAAGWLAAHLESLGFAAEILPDAGKPLVLGEMHVGDDLPTLLIYGHYDVQPPDPLDLWKTPPFEPDVRDGRIVARGANDDKGQLFTHLMAIEAWTRAGGGLPVNVKILIEGEEETGSPHLEAFIADNADRLAADAAVISDSEFFDKDTPSITCALRGMAYMEVSLTGQAADVHSGIHGGALRNPINALARLLADMHDDDGRVTVDGFYDRVVDLTDEQRQEWTALPFDEAQYARSLGVGALSGGERGFSVLERRWARPTLDANGLVGGYTGEGAKTIIPTTASMKITTRLVPHQVPAEIADGVRRFVEANTPPGLKASFRVSALARPVLLKTDTPAMAAGAAALSEAFARKPAFIRCGASVPVTELFQRLLGIDPVLMGFGLPDDNLHSPNEKFDLHQLHRGSVACAAFLMNLAGQ